MPSFLYLKMRQIIYFFSGKKKRYQDMYGSQRRIMTSMDGVDADSLRIGRVDMIPMLESI
jgi:hypothetical protein